MREALVAQEITLAEQGRYFTILAPRQSGKTTYFQLLLRTLKERDYMPIWISLEGFKTLGRAHFYILRIRFEPPSQLPPVKKAEG